MSAAGCFYMVLTHISCDSINGTIPSEIGELSFRLCKLN